MTDQRRQELFRESMYWRSCQTDLLTKQGWIRLEEGESLYAPYLWRDPTTGLMFGLEQAFEIELQRAVQLAG